MRRIKHYILWSIENQNWFIIENGTRFQRITKRRRNPLKRRISQKCLSKHTYFNTRYIMGMMNIPREDSFNFINIIIVKYTANHVCFDNKNYKFSELRLCFYFFYFFYHYRYTKIKKKIKKPMVYNELFNKTL